MTRYATLLHSYGLQFTAALAHPCPRLIRDAETPYLDLESTATQIDGFFPILRYLMNTSTMSGKKSTSPSTSNWRPMNGPKER